MSQKRNARARQHKVTLSYDKGHLTGSHAQARSDKEISGKTRGYIRVASYRPSKGDGNGKTGSKYRLVK